MIGFFAPYFSTSAENASNVAGSDKSLLVYFLAIFEPLANLGSTEVNSSGVAIIGCDAALSANKSPCAAKKSLRAGMASIGVNAGASSGKVNSISS